MIYEIGPQTSPIARKDYACDAAPWIYDGDMTGEYYTFAELRQLVKARKAKWKINKGERYIRQTMKVDGEIYTFRARPELHDICLKYSMYENL